MTELKSAQTRYRSQVSFIIIIQRCHIILQLENKHNFIVWNFPFYYNNYYTIHKIILNRNFRLKFIGTSPQIYPIVIGFIYGITTHPRKSVIIMVIYLPNKSCFTNNSISLTMTKAE